jgi:hypothetical protein
MTSELADRKIDLRPVKEEARRSLPQGSAGREALLCAQDEVTEAEFNVLIGTWIRLLRSRESG